VHCKDEKLRRVDRFFEKGVHVKVERGSPQVAISLGRGKDDWRTGAAIDQAHATDEIHTGDVGEGTIDYDKSRIDAADPVQGVGRLLETDRFDVCDTPKDLRKASERRLLVVDDGYVHVLFLARVATE
jgi:hypothetical protein